jgi:hypothetical protein
MAKIASTSELNSVLQLLINHFYQRCSNFGEYLKSSFNYPTNSFLTYSDLILVQMRDGDMINRDIGGTGLAKWYFHNHDLIPVELDFMWYTMYDRDPSDQFYIIPSFFFYLVNSEILLLEKYGANFRHMSKGKVSLQGDSAQLDLVTVLITSY